MCDVKRLSGNMKTDRHLIDRAVLRRVALVEYNVTVGVAGCKPVEQIELLLGDSLQHRAFRHMAELNV